MSWEHAACRQVDPELFFPVGNTGPALAQIDKAKAVCRSCPIRPVCAAYVIDHPEQTAHGVWAGTTEEGRRRGRAGIPGVRTARVEVSALAEDARELIAQGYTVEVAAWRLGVGSTTVQRALAETAVSADA